MTFVAVTGASAICAILTTKFAKNCATIPRVHLMAVIAKVSRRRPCDRSAVHRRCAPARFVDNRAPTPTRTRHRRASAVSRWRFLFAIVLGDSSEFGCVSVGFRVFGIQTSYFSYCQVSLWELVYPNGIDGDRVSLNQTISDHTPLSGSCSNQRLLDCADRFECRAGVEYAARFTAMTEEGGQRNARILTPLKCNDLPKKSLPTMKKETK